VKRDTDSPWLLAHIGLQLAVSVLLAFAVGYWLDKKFGTAPWLMLGCSAAGFAAGLYSVIRQTIHKDK